jgi:class 3 adenylate cyclase
MLWPWQTRHRMGGARFVGSPRWAKSIMGRILITDDDEIDRRMIARLLDELVKQGNELLQAENGEQALNIIEAQQVDVLLLDLGMPVMDGAETFTRMKACPIKRNIPVIMFSGTPEEIVRFIDLGADDCFLKTDEGLHRELLKARVRNCLEKRRFQEMADRQLRQYETEQKKLNTLVNALFPGHIVGELIAGIGDQLDRLQETIEPRRYQAAVMFCDIVGFTNYCREHARSARAVVNYLREMVARFETIAEARGLEKIKTIGDSFMVVAGLTNNPLNPVKDAVECGLEFLRVAKELEPAWELRIGIDYGQVVGGIVGSTKFQFDIWGHTVNLAARIEGAGDVGAINLSPEAWPKVMQFYVPEKSKIVDLKGVGPTMIQVVRPR